MIKLAFLLFLAICLAPVARAEFPDKNLRIVVGYPPGGVGDTVARMISDMVKTKHKQGVIVENRPGVNGLIGAQSVAKGDQDGSAVFQCNMGVMAIVPFVPGSVLPFDIEKDLVPISTMMLMTYALVTAADSPYNSVSDVIAAARATPNSVSFASTGNGSAQHLAGQMMGTFAGVSMLHVPYKGSADALVDLSARRVDLFVTSIADVASFVKNGRLKLLAFADSTGHPDFPGIPFISATVPNYDFQSWAAICGPRGMPASVKNSWAEAIRDGIRSPEVQARIRGLGGIPHFEGPDAIATRVEGNRQHFKKVISAAKIRVE